MSTRQPDLFPGAGVAINNVLVGGVVPWPPNVVIRTQSEAKASSGSGSVTFTS